MEQLKFLFCSEHQLFEYFVVHFGIMKNTKGSFITLIICPNSCPTKADSSNANSLNLHLHVIYSLVNNWQETP